MRFGAVISEIILCDEKHERWTWDSFKRGGPGDWSGYNSPGEEGGHGRLVTVVARVRRVSEGGRLWFYSALSCYAQIPPQAGAERIYEGGSIDRG